MSGGETREGWREREEREMTMAREDEEMDRERATVIEERDGGREGESGRVLESDGERRERWR